MCATIFLTLLAATFLVLTALVSFLTRFLTAANKTEIIEQIKILTDGILTGDDQFNKIASLPSYKWAIDSYNEIVQNINEITKTLSNYQTILASPQKQREIYKKEVLNLKKLPKIVR